MSQEASQETSLEKSRLRRHYLDLRAKLDRETQHQLSRTVSQEVFNWLVTEGAVLRSRPLQVVALYAAIKNEVNLLPLAKRLREQGVVTAYPKCFPKGRMMFYQVTDEQVLKPSYFGIPEPDDKSALLIAPAAIDVMLIPAVAFSANGLRLGYGGGFYDRFLSVPEVAAVTMGIGYDVQWASELPQEPFDGILDYIATEKGITTCM